MAEHFASPAPAAVADLGDAQLRDESAAQKWRVWGHEPSVSLGVAHRTADTIEFSVSPGERMILGDPPSGADSVDLTHVRAMFRITGSGARHVLEHLCAIDLRESMTPDGSAARTLVAGVATELVRDDVADAPSYLLLMSRSFAEHVWDRLVAVAADRGH